MRLVNRSRKLVELYEAETKPPTKLLKEKYATDEEEEQQHRTSCVSDLGQGTLEGNALPEEPRKVKRVRRPASARVGARQFSGWSPASSRVGRPRGCPHNTGSSLASACPAREGS